MLFTEKLRTARTMTWLIYGVLLLYSFCQLVQTLSLRDSIITTSSGPLQGLRTSNSKQFLGIPYGTAKRFEAPKIHPPWTLPLQATHVGPMCMQNCPTSPRHLCLPDMSEDCLTLNIFVPLTEPDGGSFAVMFYIHGGNYDTITGGSPLYNGDWFVKRGNVILVTINYRLGSFGFLPRVQGDKLVSGNFGLKDQVLALKWMHNNIHAFGGNKNKVTIFGQSAGAQSVLVHLLNPSLSYYFERAIVQSAPIALPFRTIKEGKKQMELFSRQLGCSPHDIVCQQSKTSAEVLDAQIATPRNEISHLYLMQFEPWGPTLDGCRIKGSLLDTLKENIIHKDIIIGTTSAEGVAYIYSLMHNAIAPMFSSLFLSLIMPGSPKINNLYGLSPDGRETLSDIVTDFIFYCPSIQFAEKLSQTQKVWFYHFEQPLSFDGWGNLTFCNGKACHGAELPFLYDTAHIVGYDVTSEDHKLSKTMGKYWTNFAKHGNPNHGGELQVWPNFKAQGGGKQFMVFKEPNVHSGTATKLNICRAMEQQGFKLVG